MPRMSGVGIGRLREAMKTMVKQTTMGYRFGGDSVCRNDYNNGTTDYTIYSMRTTEDGYIIVDIIEPLGRGCPHIDLTPQQLAAILEA